MQYSLVTLLTLLSLAQSGLAKHEKSKSISNEQSKRDIEEMKEKILHPHKEHMTPLSDLIQGRYSANKVPMKMIHMEDAKTQHRRDLRKGARAGRNVQHEVVFAVKQKNLDQIKHILHDVSNPRSPNYGKHLTKAQVREMTHSHESHRHLTAYLEANGARIVKSSHQSDYITAEAPMHVWEAMFATEFHQYSHVKSGRSVYRAEKYSLPSTLVDHVTAAFNTVQFPDERVIGLAKKPHVRKANKNAAVRSSQMKTESVIVDGYVTPDFLNEYYNVTSNTGNTLGSQAVYETINQTYSPSDLTIFQETYGVPVESVAVDIGGHSDSAACVADDGNNCGEANLDVQYIMAVSQVTPTTYYYWNGTDFMLDFVTQVVEMENPPLVISVSYSSYELSYSDSYLDQFETEAMKLGVSGITLLSAAGDDGVAGYEVRYEPEWCGYYPQFPATSQYVTAVGGTMGPETGGPEIACQSQLGGVITTGGGFSNYYEAPTWQRDFISNYFSTVSPEPVSGYSTFGRGYPDVSALAANYLVVMNGESEVLYGTSASTPVIAGFVALVNAARLAAGKSSLGWINPSLYSLYAEFANDITSGENNCVADASPCCTQGFYATTGWDPVTGLGSVNYEGFYEAMFALGDNPNEPTMAPTPGFTVPTFMPSETPTSSPTDTMEPTAAPTTPNYIAAGWAYENTYADSYCSGEVTMITGYPTNQCFGLYNEYGWIIGSTMYQCTDTAVYTTKFSDTNCTYPIATHSYEQTCDNVINDYSGTNQYSTALMCTTGSQKPLPQYISGDFATQNFYDDYTFTCSDQYISGFTSYLENHCFPDGGYYSYKFQYPNFFFYYDSQCSSYAYEYDLPLECQSNFYNYGYTAEQEEHMKEFKNKNALPKSPSSASSGAASSQNHEKVSAAKMHEQRAEKLRESKKRKDAKTAHETKKPAKHIAQKHDSKQVHSKKEKMSVQQRKKQMIENRKKRRSGEQKQKKSGTGDVRAATDDFSYGNASTYTCPPYQASNTLSATQNYAICEFVACGGSTITADDCDCNGDQYIALFNGEDQVAYDDDSSCGFCSSLSYTVPGTSDECYQLSLHEGCYGSTSCSGTFTITGVTLTPVTFPTMAPTPTAAPVAYPLIEPGSEVFCEAYNVSNTNNAAVNYASCGFSACGGTSVTMSACGCSGDTYLKLYDGYNLIKSDDDSSCGLCSQMTYTVPGDNTTCYDYILHEGCYSDNSCSAQVTLTGSSVAPDDDFWSTDDDFVWDDDFGWDDDWWNDDDNGYYYNYYNFYNNNNFYNSYFYNHNFYNYFYNHNYFNSYYYNHHFYNYNFYNYYFNNHNYYNFDDDFFFSDDDNSFYNFYYYNHNHYDDDYAYSTNSVLSMWVKEHTGPSAMPTEAPTGPTPAPSSAPTEIVPAPGWIYANYYSGLETDEDIIFVEGYITGRCIKVGYYGYYYGSEMYGCSSSLQEYTYSYWGNLDCTGTPYYTYTYPLSWFTPDSTSESTSGESPDTGYYFYFYNYYENHNYFNSYYYNHHFYNYNYNYFNNYYENHNYFYNHNYNYFYNHNYNYFYNHNYFNSYYYNHHFYNYYNYDDDFFNNNYYYYGDDFLLEYDYVSLMCAAGDDVIPVPRGNSWATNLTYLDEGDCTSDQKYAFASYKQQTCLPLSDGYALKYDLPNVFAYNGSTCAQSDLLLDTFESLDTCMLATGQYFTPPSDVSTMSLVDIVVPALELKLAPLLNKRLVSHLNKKEDINNDEKLLQLRKFKETQFVDNDATAKKKANKRKMQKPQKPQNAQKHDHKEIHKKHIEKHGKKHNKEHAKIDHQEEKKKHTKKNLRQHPDLTAAVIADHVKPQTDKKVVDEMTYEKFEQKKHKAAHEKAHEAALEQAHNAHGHKDSVRPSTTTTCPTFSVSNTNSDTQNYATCTILACGGETITASVCSSCSGDTMLYLYNGYSQVASNDDYCGLCSQLSYTVPSGSNCIYYTLREGCYSSGSCSGTVTVTTTYYYPTASPSAVPTLPTVAPTGAPSTPSFNCPVYTATDTYSASQNYATCDFIACGGSTIVADDCECSGDQYFQLYLDGYEVAYDDDSSCGFCSSLSYTVPGTSDECYTYSLHEGCYSTSSCSGMVTVSGAEAFVNSTVAIITPTPTMAPTGSTYLCPYYSASNTNYATQNYATCEFTACGGSTIVADDCDCSGDQYFQLYNGGTLVASDDDGSCGTCSQITYTVPGDASSCYTFSLHEGCYSSYSCSGQVSITGTTLDANTTTPVTYPTVGPSDSLSCDPYSVSNTNYASQNYATCGFTACGGTYLTIGECGCSGDSYLRLYSGSTLLTYDDDSSCGLCSQMTYTVPGTSDECYEYTIQEGCYSSYSCSGTVTVTGSDSSYYNYNNYYDNHNYFNNYYYNHHFYNYFYNHNYFNSYYYNHHFYNYYYNHHFYNYNNYYNFYNYYNNDDYEEQPMYNKWTITYYALPTVAPTAAPSEVPTIRPSVGPTVRPSMRPTVKPTTASPSMEPTNGPTPIPGFPTLPPSAAPTPQGSMAPTAPQTYMFSAVQNLVGLTADEYNSQLSTNNAAVASAAAASMPGINPSDIVVTAVTAVSGRRLSVMEVASTSSCNVDYNVNYNLNQLGYSGDPQGAYNNLVTSLNTNVQNGSFTTYMQSSAAALGSTTLTTASSSAVATSSYTETYTDSVDDDSNGSSSGSSAGAIAGGVIGALAFLAIVGGGYWYAMKMRGSGDGGAGQVAVKSDHTGEPAINVLFTNPMNAPAAVAEPIGSSSRMKSGDENAGAIEMGVVEKVEKEALPNVNE